MGIETKEFSALTKAFGVKIEPRGDDSYTVTGPSGDVKKDVPKFVLKELDRTAGLFMQPDAGKSIQRSAVRFADNANGKKLEGAERFGIFVVEKLVPIVGTAVAADIFGAKCKLSISACIPEKKEVA